MLMLEDFKNRWKLPGAHHQLGGLCDRTLEDPENSRNLRKYSASLDGEPYGSVAKSQIFKKLMKISYL
jgi:hypothetical protein